MQLGTCNIHKLWCSLAHLCAVCAPMPVLSRWDDEGDALQPAQRQNHKHKLWRYDPTSSESDGSEHPGKISVQVQTIFWFFKNWSARESTFLTACLLRSGESESGASSEGGGASGSCPTSSEVSLQLATLQSYTQLGETQLDESQFAANGLSPDRIRALLRDPPCECQCRLPFKTILQICKVFWSLSKEAQDAVLWSLQCSSGRKTKWLIEGRKTTTYDILGKSKNCLTMFNKTVTAVIPIFKSILGSPSRFWAL